MNPPWRYRALIRLLSPLLLGYTLWRACKDGGWRYWWQRLGIYPTTPGPYDEQLWVHAASVGEVFTVLPLIKAWRATHDGARVLLTTGTPTGALVLKNQAIEGIRHQYLPLDFPGACQRFVAQLKTRQGWIVETEIWPWLYTRCEQQGIALSIINGRLSQRTSKHANGMMGTSYRRALRHVHVLARSAPDADNFRALGSPSEQVHIGGNLKYGDSATTQCSDPPLQRSYVLAASTHDDEEMQLARSWKCHAPADALLVMVPRHPERGSSLARELRNLSLSVSQRSIGQTVSMHDSIHLADTLGELQTWYQHAAATFVGGSLIARGGHNVLEPARYSCPTIVGPHMENFADIMQLMNAAKAIQSADNAEGVVRFLLDALLNPECYAPMSARAQQLADEHQHILERYLQQLDHRCLA